MNVTIIPSDNTVILDGRAVQVDLSAINKAYRAIRYSDGVGSIETSGDNIPISNMTSFQFAIEAATAKMAELDAPITSTLDEAQRWKRAAIDDALAQKLERGMEYPPGSKRMLQIGERDQDRIGNMAIAAMAAKMGLIQWPANTVWRMADNQPLALATPDAMIALAMAAMARVNVMRKAAWAHKDAIAALATQEQLESYDPNSGWPGGT